MPDKVKISELETATSVTGSHYLAVDDGVTTKKITVDNYNSSANTTARGYAIQSANSAAEAAASVTAARSVADEVGLSINRAVELAGQAANSATAAAGSASDAHRDASAAATSALSASQSATAAQNSAASIDSAATLSKSWAVGGTNTRAGEDANNAKYWAERASDAAGGGVQTFNNRHGYVSPQSGDYSASMVTYSNSSSGLSGANVQAAIDSLNTKTNGKAPTSHANSGPTYGIGTSSLFGHVKPSDTYKSSVGNANQGIVASQKAAYDCYTELKGNVNTLTGSVSTLDGKIDTQVNTLTNSINSLATTTGTQYRELAGELTANGYRIYMDYDDTTGKYGYNIDPNRGADTFVPFRSAIRIAKFGKDPYTQTSTENMNVVYRLEIDNDGYKTLTIGSITGDSGTAYVLGDDITYITNNVAGTFDISSYEKITFIVHCYGQTSTRYFNDIVIE